MDCEERLARQCEATKGLNPASHVFAYRNLVKALPWFTAVREKLDDPQYAGERSAPAAMARAWPVNVGYELRMQVSF
jgi:hypothetical protein